MITKEDTDSDGDTAWLCLSEPGMGHDSRWCHDGLTVRADSPLLWLNDMFTDYVPMDIDVYMSHVEIGKEAPRVSFLRFN